MSFLKKIKSFLYCEKSKRGKGEKKTEEEMELIKSENTSIRSLNLPEQYPSDGSCTTTSSTSYTTNSGEYDCGDDGKPIDCAGATIVDQKHSKPEKTEKPKKTEKTEKTENSYSRIGLIVDNDIPFLGEKLEKTTPAKSEPFVRDLQKWSNANINSLLRTSVYDNYSRRCSSQNVVTVILGNCKKFIYYDSDDRWSSLFAWIGKDENLFVTPIDQKTKSKAIWELYSQQRHLAIKGSELGLRPSLMMVSITIFIILREKIVGMADWIKFFADGVSGRLWY